MISEHQNSDTSANQCCDKKDAATSITEKAKAFFFDKRKKNSFDRKTFQLDIFMKFGFFVTFDSSQMTFYDISFMKHDNFMTILMKALYCYHKTVTRITETPHLYDPIVFP